MSVRYRNRAHAGEVLAQQLKFIKFTTRPLVLAIPNGGVAVGAEIARALDAEIDAIIVRKLQIPHNTEAGFGALTSYGALLLNDRLVKSLRLSKEQIESVVERTKKQIERRRAEYHGLVGVVEPSGKDIILVDDGIASGYTMLAAIESVKQLSPRTIMVAAPTASDGAAHLVAEQVSEFICPRIGTGFVFAVADAYENWYDVPDTEVIEILTRLRN
ncbi:MAG: phosphoribosyltransferase [Candidatus Thorarchaeota archaeon]